jgi:hypothetical protein
MSKFLGIEKGQGAYFAILDDMGIFKIGKYNLHIRIRNMKMCGEDTAEEEKALAALEAV